MDKFSLSFMFRVALTVCFILLLFLMGVFFVKNKESGDTLKHEASEKDERISELISLASTTQKLYQNYIDYLPEFIEFLSRNGNLKFSYNKNWICREIFDNKRVDCYPVSRQEEELESNVVGVYMPNITVYFDDCKLVDHVVDSAPERIEREGVGMRYHFYKSLNGCKVFISAYPEINTEEKLFSILH